MELVWVTDDGTFIEATVNSAWINVAQGVGLTALILFLFLYNFRSLLVVVVTMPLTIVIGIFFMYIMGFSINTITLLAIGMSVGILVTNSIVVLESIVKKLDEGNDPVSAARIGTKEATIAVLASVGTNVVVLFPIATMESIIGLFIMSFAVTMIIMTVVSLFISFTLTPLLCSLILKPKDENSRSLLGLMERAWNWVFDKIVSVYRFFLTFLELHRFASFLLLGAVVLLLLHSLSVAGKLGASLAENPDRGEVFVKLEFPTNYNIDRTLELVRSAEEKLKDIPHLKHSLCTIGKVDSILGQASEGVYLAQILLKFSERTEREITIHELIEMIRDRMATIPDAIVTVSITSLLGGQASDIELEIAGQEFDTLNQLVLKAGELSEEIPGIIDQDTTVRQGKPELRITPDRDILADLQAPAASLGMVIRANLEGIGAGTFKHNARNYDLVVKMEKKSGKNQIGQFMFPGKPGYPILLTNLGNINETVGPVQITRVDKQRVSKLYANLQGNTPLGTVANELSASLDEKGGFPPGYRYRFTGTYEAMSEGQEQIVEAAAIAFILVILTLAAIMESFKQPIVILVTVPLSLIGIFYGLALGGKSIEIFALMGGVMLMGIVVNNAILIMDRFNVLFNEGASRHHAMLQAASERLRPILMITLAAVLGMLPMAFGRGIGAEIRNACGIASAGGILVSGLLTIFVVPVMYNMFTKRKGYREKI